MVRTPVSKAPYYNKAKRWLLSKIGELLIWAVLVVLFSLSPIYLVYNDQRVSGLAAPALKEIVMKGELLLVAASLAADSLSRLLSRSFSKRNQAGVFGVPQLVLMLASISFVLLASSEYSGLVSRAAQNGAIDAEYVYRQSRVFFFAVLVTGAGVILVD